MRIFVVEQLWPEETPNKYCANSTVKPGIPRQLECQKKCEAEIGCVGIAMSHQQDKNWCYLCLDDILKAAINEYGFYRKPQGNN